MFNSLDAKIVIAYLIITFFIGMYWSGKYKSLREYAVGDKNFSDLAMYCTLIATSASGSGVLLISSEVYKNGLVFALVAAGVIVLNILVAFFVAPRMSKFSDCISAGDMFAKYYGKIGRFLCGVTVLFVCCGAIAMQLKVMGHILSYILNIDLMKATLISSFIVIIYTTYGGIRAVIFTDILQFLTIAITLPMIFNIAVNELNGPQAMVLEIINQDLNIFEIDDHAFRKYLPLFILYCLPVFLHPVMYQRLLMAKNALQAEKAFLHAGYTLIPYILLSAGIGIVALITNKNIPANEVFIYMVDNYLPIGIKAVALICIIALVMSTADSNLNVIGVTVAHDLLHGFIKSEEAKLIISRFSIIILSSFALYIALTYKNFLDILMFMRTFWGPIIAPALFVSIFGFHTSVTNFLIAALLGVVTLFSWQYFNLSEIYIINNIIAATFVNLVSLFSLHFIFKEQFKIKLLENN